MTCYTKQKKESNDIEKKCYMSEMLLKFNYQNNVIVYWLLNELYHFKFISSYLLVFLSNICLTTVCFSSQFRKLK